jgi:Mg2+-importing ATPase
MLSDRDVRREVPITELVPGDIIHLSAGDMVPADVRLIDTKDLFVSQSTLTGEAMPVEKYVVLEDPSREDSKAPFSQYASPLEMPGFCFMGTSPWISCARIRLERSPKTEWF